MHTSNRVINTLCKSKLLLIVQKALYAAEAVGVENIGNTLWRGLHACVEPVLDHGGYRRYQKSLQALGQLIAHLTRDEYFLLNIIVGMPCDDLEHRVMIAVGTCKNTAELFVFLQKLQGLQRVETLEAALAQPLLHSLGQLILKAVLELIWIGVMRVKRTAVYVRLAADLRHAYLFYRLFGEQPQKAVSV